MTDGDWPLVVGSARLLPAGHADLSEGGTVHFAHEVPALSKTGEDSLTLCGRPALLVVGGTNIEVFGRDHDRLCGSCWRIVEGWLEPPSPADGEDLVVAWLVETVLAGGSAMIEEVPFGRVRRVRERARQEIKAAIGGSVSTARITATTIVVYSALVIDAKTEDQQRRELFDAVQRLDAVENDGDVTQPAWRRTWSQVIAAGT